jgi:predicted dehydrogenase
MKCLLPFSTQPVAVFLAWVLMPCASEPAPDSVMAMAQVRSARHRGLEPALDLLALAFEDGLVHVAEGAADQDVGGVAELLFAQDAVHGREAAATQRLGNVHGVEAERLGLALLWIAFGLGRFFEKALVLDLVFERLELVLDEATHGVDHHFLLVVEVKVHAGSALGQTAAGRRLEWSDLNIEILQVELYSDFEVGFIIRRNDLSCFLCRPRRPHARCRHRRRRHRPHAPRTHACPPRHRPCRGRPTPAAKAFCAYAAQIGVPWFATLPRDAGAHAAEGAVIVATPNHTHADVGLACIARNLPVLMEKPVTDTVAQGRRLCDAAEAAGVPLMVGHQRRHNPILRSARQLIADGVVGRPVSVDGDGHVAQARHATSSRSGAARGRRRAGADQPDPRHRPAALSDGRDRVACRPHDLQCRARLRGGRHGRGDPALRLRRAGGAPWVSDATVAPWNWDLAAGEAAHYVQQDVNTHHISGTEGSLTLPRLDVWRYAGRRGWHEPLTQTRTPVHRADPYVEQMRHLRAVAEGREAPVCSGVDGLRTLEAALAVHEAARLQRTVTLQRGADAAA